MRLSLQVFTPEGAIGVSDGAYDRLDDIYIQYGNCPVAVYDANDVFGKGYDAAEAYEVTTINRLEW